MSHVAKIKVPIIILTAMVGILATAILIFLIPHWLEIEKVFRKYVNQTEIENLHQIKFVKGQKILKEDLELLGLLSHTNTHHLPVFIQDLWVVFKEDFVLDKVALNKCQHPHCFQQKIHFSQIPSSIWEGLIAIEDKRYLDHPGVDLKSLARALVQDIKQLKLEQGGSTITQQLIKNLFLSQEKSLLRKIIEAIDSLYVEARFDKRDIINVYLNECFWGALQNTRIVGVSSASWFYFKKQLADLNEHEALILISILKGPNYFNPLKGISRIRERVEAIIKVLTGEGYFSGEFAPWSDEKWKEWESKIKQQQEKMPDRFLGEITEQDYLRSYDIFGQMIFEKTAFEGLQKIFQREPSAKDVVIKAYFLRDDCTEEKDCDEILFYSKKERDLLKAINDEKHQVGSILKPIIYSILLKNGLSKNDEVSTDEVTLKLKSGTWTPKEATLDLTKRISLEEALQRSRNIPLIKFVEMVGWEKVEKELKAKIPSLKIPLREFPSQLLGSIELTLSEVAHIYKQFMIKECLAENAGDGEVLKMLSDPTKTTLRKVIDPLISEGRFFGKTGTTNQGKDSWFIGYDGASIGVVFAGNESPDPKMWASLSGANAAFRVYQEFWKRRGYETPLAKKCPTLQSLQSNGFWDWPW